MHCRTPDWRSMLSRLRLSRGPTGFHDFGDCSVRRESRSLNSAIPRSPSPEQNSADRRLPRPQDRHHRRADPQEGAPDRAAPGEAPGPHHPGRHQGARPERADEGLGRAVAGGDASALEVKRLKLPCDREVAGTSAHRVEVAGSQTDMRSAQLKVAIDVHGGESDLRRHGEGYAERALAYGSHASVTCSVTCAQGTSDASLLYRSDTAARESCNQASPSFDRSPRHLLTTSSRLPSSTCRGRASRPALSPQQRHNVGSTADQRDSRSPVPPSQETERNCRRSQPKIVLESIVMTNHRRQTQTLREYRQPSSPPPSPARSTVTAEAAA